MLLHHDAPRQIQTEASAFTDRLGGEERREDATDVLFGDAGAVVPDLDPDHALALTRGPYRQRAVTLHGLNGVGDEDVPELIQIAGIARDFGYRLVPFLHELDGFVAADLVAEEGLQRAVQQLVDIGHLIRGPVHL